LTIKNKGKNMAKEQSFGICPYQIMNGFFYVLLNKTSEESFYNFFKGKTEEGEIVKETAIREFYEETGIKISESDLEDYFFQKSPRKDIGIFLVDWNKYQDSLFSFQEREIWSASWVQLKDGDIMSKNQQKIFNDINLAFSDKKNSLKNLYKG